MSKKNERLHRGLWKQISRPQTVNVVVPLTDVSITSQCKRVTVIGLKDREYLVEVRDIVLRCLDGHLTMSAAVIGNWAVHPALEGTGLTVTHAKSGIAIDAAAAALEMGEALEIATRLNMVPEEVMDVAARRFRDDWDQVALAIVGEVLGG